ncbi:hypothetical protein [Kibdelosporangium philippinense]|uniref:hypothetical protein n=1 Tax=Kibdelosporangium philippinense TaxID=211113 RepID=UPI003607AA69
MIPTADTPVGRCHTVRTAASAVASSNQRMSVAGRSTPLEHSVPPRRFSASFHEQLTFEDASCDCNG